MTRTDAITLFSDLLEYFLLEGHSDMTIADVEECSLTDSYIDSPKRKIKFNDELTPCPTCGHTFAKTIPGEGSTLYCCKCGLKRI